MEELVGRAKNGDEKAFAEIVQGLEKDLYRIAGTRLKSDDDICDAIQNTVIYAYKSIKKVKHVEYFKTWIVKILINECNKIYKLNKKNDEIVQRVIVTEKNDGNEFYEEFTKIIDGLGSDEQLIFTLYYKDSFSCEEIAKVTGFKKNTIKSKLARGREKIKKILEEEKRYEY